jgi:hypothetical protein
MTTETTTTLAIENTGRVWKKTERYDADVMHSILNDKDFPRNVLTCLSVYQKDRTSSSYRDVIYEFSKEAYAKHQVGRLYVKHMGGLQGFPFDVRNPLLDKYYWDCDMENAHYWFLAQMGEKWSMKTEAIRQYVSNRDEELAKVSPIRRIAKTTFLKVAYGGDITLYNEFYKDSDVPATADKTLLKKIETEVSAIAERCWEKNVVLHKLAKKHNPVYSLLSLVLQTEERKCLLAIDDYMASVKREVGVYIHDGCGILKKEDETAFPEELLRGAEAYVKQKEGWDIHLVAKKFKHDYTVKRMNDLLPSDVLVNDVYAARVFVELMGDHLVYDGEVFCFNSETGIWGSDVAHIERVITQQDKKLVFKQEGALGVRIYDYSGSVKNVALLIKSLHRVLPKRDGFFAERLNSDIEKLLFKDGIYDFKTATFTKAFDPNVVFFYSCPRNFPKRDQKIVDFINHTTFEDPFEGSENSDILKHNLMRATIGDYLRKTFVAGIGKKNSSKSITITLVRTAFGKGLVQSFNGNSLLAKGYDMESARELTWLVDVAKGRFAFGSEIRVSTDEKRKVVFDGNLIKNIVSGGDDLKGRKLKENEVSIVNKANFFLFANDLPTFSPMTSELAERIHPVNWSYSYVSPSDMVYPFHKPLNPQLANLYSTAEYGDAFIWIMIDEYNKWRADGYAELKTPVIREGRADLMPVKELEKVLFDEFEATGNPFDKVLFRDIAEFLRQGGVDGTDTKFGRDLTAMGIKNKDVKIDRKTASYRIGIRRKAQAE